MSISICEFILFFRNIHRFVRQFAMCSQMTVGEKKLTVRYAPTDQTPAAPPDLVRSRLLLDDQLLISDGILQKPANQLLRLFG